MALADSLRSALVLTAEFSPDNAVAVETHLGHTGHAATIGGEVAVQMAAEMAASAPFAAAIAQVIADMDARYAPHA